MAAFSWAAFFVARRLSRGRRPPRTKEREMTRRLTGFQPTGRLHLGNLLGAMLPLVDDQASTESIAMIADLHAMTMDHDPSKVRAATLEVAAVLLAAGVDPDR